MYFLWRTRTPLLLYTVKKVNDFPVLSRDVRTGKSQIFFTVYGAAVLWSSCCWCFVCIQFFWIRLTDSIYWLFTHLFKSIMRATEFQNARKLIVFATTCFRFLQNEAAFQFCQPEANLFRKKLTFSLTIPFLCKKGRQGRKDEL